VTQVSKSAFRKAQCCGALDGCEVCHGVHGSDWLRNGRVVAAMRTGLLSSTYYLGE
jgi:hypothetical protein